MAGKNRKCLLCGEPYHHCGTCDGADWAWTYCTEECWFSSPKAFACLALGNKLAGLLEPHELALLKAAVGEEPHYLDRVVDGLKLSGESFSRGPR